MTETTVAPVRTDITVEVPQEHAWKVFTERMDAWWPASHHTGPGTLAGAYIEPREGGRWYERTVEGGESEWGTVLTWQPHERLVLSWQLDATFEYDPDFVTEVEVRFVAETPHRTRVELEHRNLDRYGDAEGPVREQLAGEGGWSELLALFAGTAAR